MSDERRLTEAELASLRAEVERLNGEMDKRDKWWWAEIERADAAESALFAARARIEELERVLRALIAWVETPAVPTSEAKEERIGGRTRPKRDAFAMKLTDEIMRSDGSHYAIYTLVAAAFAGREK